MFILLCVLAWTGSPAQTVTPDPYDVVWRTPSKNSGGSMPCGGGDIGLNVWAEHGDILFYMATSGAFDETNALLKLGRIRVHLTPDPFEGGTFRQVLHLRDGSVYIRGSARGYAATVHLWVDVFRPVIHLSIHASRKITAEVGYESWRSEDHVVKGKENDENSYKFAPQGIVKVYRDHIGFTGDGVLFFHRNRDTTVFDVTVAQQHLNSVKTRLFNPLKARTFGGLMKGKNLRADGTYAGKYLNTPYRGWRLKSIKPFRDQEVSIYLHTAQSPTAEAWRQGLHASVDSALRMRPLSWEKTARWWKAFWERSFIDVSPGPRKDSDSHWQAGRNYQLFRYMLACNARGVWPTKFNGGLFTFDPVLVNPADTFSPDFRRWGGGTFTAQNQRLLYYPMLPSGDWDMMRSAFNFYLRLLPTAELRSKVYWGHAGACFTEQLENFGLPDCSEYGWKRPAYFDPGMQYNAWLEYQWDTALEFCWMILRARSYGSVDIAPYLPLIKSCLDFFGEHYRYLAERRGRKSLDQYGHLILFPGSAAETYKMTLNAGSTIAALKTVLGGVIALPSEMLSEKDRTRFTKMLGRIPPLPLGSINGHTTLAPAESWERINNVETPQLYPVFPWHRFGLGKPGLDTALNTWRYDTAAIKNRSYIGWKQDNIFAACLGLTSEADRLTMEKLKNGPERFPAFWGPGFDWMPDHNWGGSGMIGLQEMLLQSDGRKILLFPAWPRSVDVHFRLHAPRQTLVEATLTDGKITSIQVTPASRKKDVVNLLSR